jgi:hypothetical protein
MGLRQRANHAAGHRGIRRNAWPADVIGLCGPAPAVAARAAAIVLFACSVGFFFHDRHHQVDNYYFSWDRLDAVKHIHVYHDAKYTAY